VRTQPRQEAHLRRHRRQPANLFYSTGIPVCILVLKKCKKPDDVLFINAAAYLEKVGKTRLPSSTLAARGEEMEGFFAAGDVGSGFLPRRRGG